MIPSGECGVWAEGDYKATLEAIDEDDPVLGQNLIRMANNVSQIIDGKFTAFESGCSDPWVIVEAVDSSFYTVRSNDTSVLAKIRTAFRDVSDYQQPM